MKNILDTLPNKPGVYKFKDSRDKIIYIGKAKDIKKRVAQYFKTGSHKNEYFKSLIKGVEYILTNSETEALLLEINLIKEEQPRYNVIFKDDKTYPYICLVQKEGNVNIETRRSRLAKDKNCFGPYPDGSKAFAITRVIQEIFQLRKCNTKDAKRCIYKQLGQCLHLKDAEKEQYYIKVEKEIKSFLKGDSTLVEKHLESKMESFAALEEFESASKYKKLISNISSYNNNQIISTNILEESDYINFAIKNNKINFFIIHVRFGKVISTFNKEFTIVGQETDAISQFVSSFYDKRPIPEAIYMPKGSFNDSLIKILDINIKVPLIGKKSDILKMAKINAETYYKNSQMRDLKEEQDLVMWNKIKIVAGIDLLERIEIYDASHISGSNYVGAKVEFLNGKYNSSMTRKYNLKELKSSNDIKALKLILEKRFRNDKDIPDLIIVDGSLAQFRAAKNSIKESGLIIPIIGLIKNDQHKTEALLDKNGYRVEFTDRNFRNFMAKMQNKVHDVAISYHKNKRNQTSIDSWLDNIEGIGPVAIRKLILEFGSIQKIKKAKLNELEKVVSTKGAKNIISKVK